MHTNDSHIAKMKPFTLTIAPISMPAFSSLFAFVIASLVLWVIPGPVVLYIVAKSIEQGMWVGIVSVLGISSGFWGHVVVAAAGISALLMTAVFIFTLVKYAGAVYLMYPGPKKMLWL